MVQSRNPAGEGGASDGSVHAAKLNTSDHTRATATHQVLCGCLTDSPDGQPWPPSDSNALWVIVRRWRLHALARNQLAQVRTAATDFCNLPDRQQAQLKRQL